MKKWCVSFSENGCEYIGTLYIDANDVIPDENNSCVFYADGVRIEIDEYIVGIDEV